MKEGHTMNDRFSLINKLAPDVMDILKERYRILKEIRKSQPVGRRMLSEKVGLTERSLRTEIEVLRNQKLIVSSTQGMRLTSDGEDIVYQLAHLTQQKDDMEEKTARLTRLLNIKEIHIIPGDSDEEPETKRSLGRLVAKTLNINLPGGQNTIGVMGGTTMAQAAEQFHSELSQNRELVFVPARGGMGANMDIQANVICEEMARRTNGKSYALYVPEHVSSEIQPFLLEEPHIRRTLSLLHGANCVLFSISTAHGMAERRESDARTMELLEKENAVGEAFGDYFDQAGNVVYNIPHIGLHASELGKIPLIIAAAGGKSKAKAIAAYAKCAPSSLILITDEGAANQILLNEKQKEMHKEEKK